jgi:hypothetical protein
MDTQSMMNVRMTANPTGRDGLGTWKKIGKVTCRLDLLSSALAWDAT